MTNQRTDGWFDENHVMVTLSLPVVVFCAHPLAAAPQDRIATNRRPATLRPQRLYRRKAYCAGRQKPVKCRNDGPQSTANSWRSRQGRKDRRTARPRAGEPGPPRGRRRRMPALVRADGGIWRARAAFAHDHPVSECRLCLARGQVPALRSSRQPGIGSRSPAARYTDLEIGSVAQMPSVQDAPICPTGANGPARQGAKDRPLRLGPSRR